MKLGDINVGGEYAVNIYGWSQTQREHPARAEVLRKDVAHDRVVTVGTGRGSRAEKRHFTNGIEIGILTAAQGQMRVGSTHIVEARNIHSTWEDFEAERERRRGEAQEAAKHRREVELSNAVSRIEQALNRGEEAEVGKQLRQIHSSLLGKLANEVLGEVARREGDGRLAAFNRPVESYHSNGNVLKVSDVRQA